MQPRNVDSVVIDSLNRKDEGVSPEAKTTMIMDRKIGCGSGPFRPFNTNQQKVVGVTEAIKNSWPGIVALKNNGRQFCGGSLISPTHILTSAHCVAHMSSRDVSRLTVELGIHFLKLISDGQVSKKVRRVIRHKGFDSRTLYNDIAVLTMESPVFFTSVISPVCLPPLGSNDQYTDKDAAVIGWGALKEGGSQPNALQQVTVQIIANSKCKSSYGSDARGGIVDHMLCTAYPGKDACSGDSGGPLLVQSSPGSPWIQAGIVSGGIGCVQAKYPGVYTRVTSFTNWIGKNTV
ncbi:trypsin alpha-3-like [Daphnia pulicaria]|uniref:trypsin alpha-3-like n=1 Tax=Daphnia pulicaria TaxID=35523 RepID=UPI001EEC7296|nr:trypsin alpha-3-like [Daphnia pulicaria]